MLVLTASAVFGQSKSDSTLVANKDLIKQIELNDKRKAQWDYCVDAITQADSVVYSAKMALMQQDSVIALRGETIKKLKDDADNEARQKEIAVANLKLQKRKTFIKSVSWGVGCGAVGFTVGALFLMTK